VLRLCANYLASAFLNFLIIACKPFGKVVIYSKSYFSIDIHKSTLEKVCAVTQLRAIY
jgi:hypothetical protein